MFAAQHELQDYTEYIIRKHGLREKTELNANVVEIHWDEDESKWIIRTEKVGDFKAHILINASGPLSTPVTPKFKGQELFKGVSFHTNNWDQNYDYKNKRVAIIGSGASAAQVIPTIAPDVKHLHVFQRTPHWVMPRFDHVFSPTQRKLLSNKLAYKFLRTLIYWALELLVIGFKYSTTLLKLTVQKRAIQFLEEKVKDPVLRAKLTPDYTIGCKRMVISNTLYPALTRPNVTLNSKEEGIKEMTETGIITLDGRQLDLDLIVYSTGYDASDGVISYPVIGKGGKSLADVWSEYPRAYLGTTVSGFPNLFIIFGPNTGIGHTSAIFIIESQLEYVMKSIHIIKRNQLKSLEVRAKAEEKYTRNIHREMEKTVWKQGGCNSWYQSKSGHVVAMYPGFSFTFRRLTTNFRKDHHLFNGNAMMSRVIEIDAPFTRHFYFTIILIFLSCLCSFLLLGPFLSPN